MSIPSRNETERKLIEAKVNFRKEYILERFYGEMFVFPKLKDLRAAAKAFGISEYDIRFRPYFKEWCLKFF
jgi:hypothetical protein